MSLFVVERYLGDEAETGAKDNKDHLANLISKIEQREKSKCTINTPNQRLNNSVTNVCVRSSSKYSGKEKKHKVKQVVGQIEEVSSQEVNIDEDKCKNHHHLVKQEKQNMKQEIEENEHDDEAVQNLIKLKKRKIKNKLDKSVEVTPDESLLLQNDYVKERHKKKKKKNRENSIQENGDIDLESNEISQSNVGEEADNDLLNSSKEVNGNFTIIGDHSFNRNKEVRRVLPQWLAKPSVISVDLKHLKDDIYSIPHLNKVLINKLQENGVTHFFPVQSQLIPFLLKSERTRSSYIWPVDVCVSAPTGSGKTLAFVLPIVQNLSARLITELRVIVILPVQDLAAQVAGVFRKYVKGTGLSVYMTVGGTPLHEEQQHLVKQRADGRFESLVDILVTTPGRLVDHIYSTQGFTLKNLRYIVIDEADRVMDNFQNDWLYHLDNHLKVPGCPSLTLANLQTMPLRPQKLLFSATLSSDPEKLSELGLFQPRLFTSVVVSSTKKGGDENKFIGKYTTPAELKEYMVLCDRTVKPLVLFRLILRELWSHVLVFASTTQNVHNLATLLGIFGDKMEQSVQVAEINATMPRLRRQQLIESFTAGLVNVLVSTDSLARGIDIPGVRYVINYDVPKFIKSYIHRIGRTGRAGHDGTAVSLLSHEQVERFTNLLKTAGKHEDIKEIKVKEEELEEFEEMYKEALQSLKRISEEQQKKQKEDKIMSNKVVIGKIKRTQANTRKLKRLKKKERKK